MTQRDAESSILWTVEYEYDPLNRLVHRTETPMEESPVEQFWAYDEGINSVLQFDGDGEVTHRYLWSGAVDQLLADEQVTSTSSGGNVLWPLADHLERCEILPTTTRQQHNLGDQPPNLQCVWKTRQ